MACTFNDTTMSSPTPPNPILSTALKQIEADLAQLPPDAKAVLIVEGRTARRAIAVGTAARFGDGWVFSAEAEFQMTQKPSGRFSVGKVWK